MGSKGVKYVVTLKNKIKSSSQKIKIKSYDIKKSNGYKCEGYFWALNSIPLLHVYPYP